MKRAFTLIELLVVLAIIALLATLLLPVLTRAQGKASSIYCTNNLKQLQIAWLLYAHDNNDSLPLNTSRRFGSARRELAGSWIVGNAALDVTTSNVQSGSIFTYASATSIYRCPTDRAAVTGVPSLRRTRSYSMSFWMNGDKDATLSSPYNESQADYPEVKSKLSRIQEPTFVFIDENEQSIDDGMILVGNWIPPQYRWVPNIWYELPSDRHQRGCCLSFADGHVEHWRWRYPKPFRGLGQPTATLAQDPQQLDLADLRRLQACLPLLP